MDPVVTRTTQTTSSTTVPIQQLNTNDQAAIKQQQLDNERAFLPIERALHADRGGQKADNGTPAQYQKDIITDKPQHQYLDQQGGESGLQRNIPGSSQVATAGTSYGGDDISRGVSNIQVGQPSYGQQGYVQQQPHHVRDNAVDLTQAGDSGAFQGDKHKHGIFHHDKNKDVLDEDKQKQHHKHHLFGHHDKDKGVQHHDTIVGTQPGATVSQGSHILREGELGRQYDMGGSAAMPAKSDEKFQITDDLDKSTKGERNLNITDCRSETDLMTLMWESYKPNDKDELKNESLKDIMADMGIIDTRGASDDLMKFNETESHRQTMGSFMNWWRDHGYRWLQGRHTHGSWWLMNQLRHFFNQPGQVNQQFPVTTETLAAALASIQCGSSHVEDTSNLSSGVVVNDCVGDRPNIGVMSPSLIEARDRVSRWWKHMSWDQDKQYSVFDMMKAMTMNKRSLLTLWPDLPRMTAPDIAKQRSGDANTNVNLKYNHAAGTY